MSNQETINKLKSIQCIVVNMLNHFNNDNEYDDPMLQINENNQFGKSWTSNIYLQHTLDQVNFMLTDIENFINPQISIFSFIQSNPLEPIPNNPFLLPKSKSKRIQFRRRNQFNPVLKPILDLELDNNEDVIY